MELLPKHLRKYIVEQNYEKYTPINQASWRFVLRQLRAFLATHAHESYLEGLEKTGIEVERIPRIEEISAKLEKFGWRALPVSGFIPPAAFMELQSLSVLPIASDMRAIDHLMYTPAPDIVHEAAGHAPILIQPEFAAYLKQYAQVAKKAIISREDLNLYEAIRILSDVKENPNSTSVDIQNAQNNLDKVAKSMSFVSEAAQLGRMNWWTAEYGLIGDANNPKIFGAGLLSSVGEAKWCLSDKVKKLPISWKCVEMSYDITEPQPQLYVTPDFKTLSKVLDDFANTMAFKTGGLPGLKKAQEAKTINTIQLSSGIQISGFLDTIHTPQSEEPSYLQFKGPTQLSHEDKEIAGHSKAFHKDGFGTAIGFLKNFPDKCISDFSETDLKTAGLLPRKKVQLQFTSGVTVEAHLMGVLRKRNKIVLLSFSDCTVTLGSQKLFEPSWGVYDLAVGSKIISVFGGPADRESFGEIEDFVAARVPMPVYSDSELTLHEFYQSIRDLREKKSWTPKDQESLQSVWTLYCNSYSRDWLLNLEILELLQSQAADSSILSAVKSRLDSFKQQNPQQKTLIEDGIALASQP